MKYQRWPEKLIIMERSGTRFVTMVTKLISSYYRVVSFAAVVRVVTLRDDPNNGCEGD